MEDSVAQQLAVQVRCVQISEKIPSPNENLVAARKYLMIISRFTIPRGCWMLFARDTGQIWILKGQCGGHRPTNAFDPGVYSHGYFDFGLNRLLRMVLELEDVHEAGLSPSDVQRIGP